MRSAFESAVFLFLKKFEKPLEISKKVFYNVHKW